MLDQTVMALSDPIWCVVICENMIKSEMESILNTFKVSVLKFYSHTLYSLRKIKIYFEMIMTQRECSCDTWGPLILYLVLTFLHFECPSCFSFHSYLILLSVAMASLKLARVWLRDLSKSLSWMISLGYLGIF